MTRTRIKTSLLLSETIALETGDWLRLEESGAIRNDHPFSLVTLTDSGSVLRNAGTIAGWGAPCLYGDLEGSITLDIFNSGIIEGTAAVRLTSSLGSTGTVQIVNEGLISSRTDPGIDLSSLFVDHTLIINRGYININPPYGHFSTSYVAYMGSPGQDRFINHGKLGSAVYLGAGDDIYRDLGVRSEYSVSLFGGDGDDRIFAGSTYHFVRGGGGRDIMSALGPAVFIFEAVTDSSPDIEQADRIRGFDKTLFQAVSLRNIDADTTVSGDQAFRFIGTAAFSHTPGELRCDIRPGIAHVFADVDGDGTADFALVVRGPIDAADDLSFVL